MVLKAVILLPQEHNGEDPPTADGLPRLALNPLQDEQVI